MIEGAAAVGGIITTSTSVSHKLTAVCSSSRGLLFAAAAKVFVPVRAVGCCSP